MLTPPRLPGAVRAMNTLGRPLARVLPQLSLSEDALVGEARRRTGLSDFGEDDFRVGLRTLLRSLEEEAHLTPMGRVIARTQIVDALATRLLVTDWRATHPETREQRIERPIVIVGMGRTGTSILHDLLAEDVRNRVPLTWEVARPVPAPETATYASDPRIAETDRQLERTELLIPHFKSMHPMGARLPQECVSILAPEFASMVFEVSFRVPSYTRWLHGEADMAAAYRGHRRTLELLQSRHPGRWVLKSPCHLWHLDAVLDEYPDALFVQTHRDPLRVLASLTSLTTTLRGMATRPSRNDPLEIAREWAHLDALAFEAAVDAREQGRIPPDRVLDVQFAEFMADPFATLRSIYEFAGLVWTEEAESRMRAHLAANPADKHGKHTYRWSDTGLDAAEERERVKRYQEYFDVPSERLS